MINMLPENFDWEFYLEYYEDLRLAGLKTEEDAKKHYLNHGQYENRIYFDYNNYEYVDDKNVFFIKEGDNRLKVKLTGAFFSNTGYGFASRDLFHQLKNLDIDLYLEKFDNGNDNNIVSDIIPFLNKSSEYYDLNITVSYLYPERVCKKSKNNAFLFYWEVEKLNNDCVRFLNNNPDVYILTTGGFIENVLSKYNTQNKVFRINHLHDNNRKNLVFNKIVKYYTIAQDVPRKNLEQTIRCFGETFKHVEDVIFNVKISKFNRSLNYYRNIIEVCGYDNINIVEGVLSDEDIKVFHQNNDIFYLAQHSEGYGLPHINALFIGNEIVTTNYGSLSDYLNLNNSYLINYSMGPIEKEGGGRDFYEDGNYWAIIEDSDIKKELLSSYTNLKKNVLKNNKNLPTNNHKIVEFVNIFKNNSSLLEDFFNNGLVSEKYPLTNKNSNNKTVIVETRILKHLPYTIKNTIQKMGDGWGHIVYCSKNNYDFLLDSLSNILDKVEIKILEKDIKSRDDYNNLLLSKNFWVGLNCEKVLIYQTDSYVIDHFNDKFLNFDFIGANLSDKNFNNVYDKYLKEKFKTDKKSFTIMNGGFSLRNVNTMIDILINDEPDINTIGQDLEFIPEDVFFSSRLKNNIPKIHDISSFSFEEEFHDNTFGCHIPKLYIHEIRDKIKSFNKKLVAISSPYGMDIGGGEIFSLNMAKYFIDVLGCYVLLFNDSDMNTNKNTITHVLGEDYLKNFYFYNYNSTKYFYKKVDYHIDVYNSKTPTQEPIGIIKNIFYCQFPFDYLDSFDINKIIKFDEVMVNSDFVKYHYDKSVNNEISSKILYPIINNNHGKNFIKNKKSIVMVGRIFEYDDNSHNKNFDKALDIISKIDPNLEINVIGWVYSEKMLNKLKSYNLNNINFYTNCGEDKKNEVLSKSEFILNMTGFGRGIEGEPYSYEHFGIAIIEGINLGCIPITIGGGYPSYYINKKNGFVFNNEGELESIIKTISKGEYNVDNLKKIDVDCYNYENFKKRMGSLLV